MNSPSKSALTCLVVLGLGLSACAEPPAEDIANARTSLETAKAAEAETWAGEDWQQAQDAMNAVDVELEAQAGKMALTRSYKHASELIAVAEQKAATAQTAAIAAKETARKAAADALKSVQGALESAQGLSAQLAECPKKPKGFDADMAVMNGNLEALGGELTAVQSLYDSASYAAATQEAGALAEQVGVLSADLQNVMQKIGCNPPEVEPAG